MRKVVSILLVGSLIGGLLGGCVRYENGKPVNAPKEEQKKEKQEEQVKVETPKKEISLTNQQATDDLQKYLKDNFSSSSWYGLIKEVYVSPNNKAFVRTTVNNNAEGKKSVEGIKSAIWSFTNTNDSKYHFTEVDMYDKNGHMFITESNPIK